MPHSVDSLPNGEDTLPDAPPNSDARSLPDGQSSPPPVELVEEVEEVIEKPASHENVNLEDLFDDDESEADEFRSSNGTGMEAMPSSPPEAVYESDPLSRTLGDCANVMKSSGAQC